jgi:hypothetical protein
MQDLNEERNDDTQRTNTFNDIDDYDDSKNLSPSKVSLTLRREQIIQKYQKVFKNTDVKALTFSPSLITRVELMKTIEQVYDKQVETLLKTKTRYSLDLAKLTRMTLKANFKNNSKAFLQRLVSIIYSAEKYRDVKELNFFLKFLYSKKMNAQYLFYLYLRQHFKIITNTNFMNINKEAKQNPVDLFVTSNEAQDIIKKGFYDDDVNCQIIIEGFKNKFKGKKKISYYEFLSGMTELELNHGDLEIMTNLIALYQIKSRRNLQQMSFERENEEEGIELGDEQNPIKQHKVSANNNIDDLDENEEMEVDLENIKDKLERIILETKDKQVKDKLKNILSKNIPVSVVENKQLFDYLNNNRNKTIPPDQLAIILKGLDQLQAKMDAKQKEGKKPEEEPNPEGGLKSIMKKGMQTKFKTPFQQILSVKNISFTPTEQEIQIEMGDELNNFVKKLVYNFIDQNDIMIMDLDRHSVEAINQIYKKLYYLCLSVFMKDKNSWNKILRIKKNEDVDNFWEEICELYDQMVDTNDQDDILGFLHKLFDNQLISKQVIFYLNFYFENEEEINEITATAV